MTAIDVKPATTLSDDVQDILRLSRKLAQKEKLEGFGDRHILLALLKECKLFSRLDALLKNAGAPPRKLMGWYALEAKDSPISTLSLTALDKASDYALADGVSHVKVEYLLMGLCASEDPLVTTVLGHMGLTADKIKRSLAITDAKSVPRMVLFSIREIIEVVAVVLFLVIVIKQGLGEFRLIPSESMVPTLQVGDRIVVEKVTHWLGQKPHRGDILVFYPPEPESILRHDPWSVFLRLTGFSGILYDKDSKIDTAFIKRLIGLPGDIVDVRPGKGVYINGKKLDEPYVNEIASTCTFIYQCGPVKVPANDYYMMGDNRNHSADSRYWQFLPEDRVIGRAVFRFFPLDKRFGVLQLPSTVIPAKAGIQEN